MSFIIVCFFLSVILLFLSSLHYLIRFRDIKLNQIEYLKKLKLILKVIIISYSISLITVLGITSNFFRFISEALTIYPLVSLSMIFIISSIVLFTYSFQIAPKYIIELEKPSRLKSRTGTIKLGKVMTKNKTKGNFYLDLSDLAQHMFICGITGAGKSNFIQNFLLNFTKHHKFPFLLTEFKGEYQFLQRKIQDLLLIIVKWIY